MSAYSIPQTRKCPSCFFDTDDPMHFRLHVIPKNWPAWMSGGAARTPDVAVSGGASAPASSVLADAADVGTPRPPEAATIVTMRVAKVRAPELHICGECAFGALSAAGLAAHQRKHAREAVTSG